MPIGDTVGTAAVFVENDVLISELTWTQLAGDIADLETRSWTRFDGKDLCPDQLYRAYSHGMFLAHGGILTVKENFYMAVLCQDDIGNTHLCSATHGFVCRV
jgi:hypothetical protein